MSRRICWSTQLRNTQHWTNVRHRRIKVITYFFFINSCCWPIGVPCHKNEQHRPRPNDNEFVIIKKPRNPKNFEIMWRVKTRTITMILLSYSANCLSVWLLIIIIYRFVQTQSGSTRIGLSTTVPGRINDVLSLHGINIRVFKEVSR